MHWTTKFTPGTLVKVLIVDKWYDALIICINEDPDLGKCVDVQFTNENDSNTFNGYDIWVEELQTKIRQCGLYHVWDENQLQIII